MSGKSLWQYLLLPRRGQDTKCEHGKHIQENLNTSKSEVALKGNWMEKDLFLFWTIHIFSFLNNKTSDSSEHEMVSFCLLHIETFPAKTQSCSFSQQKDCISLLWLLPVFITDLSHICSPVTFHLSDYLTSVPTKISHICSFIKLKRTVY